MNKSGIYKLKWKEGYFYFGQAQNMKNRRIDHFSRLKSGKHANCFMQNVFNKYGLPTFEVIELCELRFLNEREQKHIDFYMQDLFCCNLSPTANGQRGIKRSLATRKAISKARAGSVLSEPHKKAISVGLYNAYSTGIKRKPNLIGSSNPFYGKNHSENTCNKFSEQRKGRGEGSSNIKAKEVLDLETGIYYGCISEAAFSIGLSATCLRKRLNKFSYSRIFKLC